ncbi:MAG TPA: SDR family oxidoreductase [Gemmatimonadales bacterium]
MTARHTILLTGATGYVGGQLLPELERLGHAVRCLARSPEALQGRTAPGTEVVAGDLTDAASVAAAMRGITTVYFLVHSMGQPGSFEALDRDAAANVADAAVAAGVARIVYLGGLGDDREALSPHLRSRHEVGEILRERCGAGGPEVVELRASIVIGSGSVSFEMIRALVERLPVMVTPRWVSVLAQPIAVADLLAYLVAALELPARGHRIYEIGGRDQLSYRDIMRVYARQRGLRRLMIPVPLLTPRLSSLWLALVTPVHARVGRALVDSIRHPTLVRDPSAARDFPVVPRGIEEAVAAAIATGARDRRNRLVDDRSVVVSVPPERAFAAISRIGGRNGWYYGNWLWRLRGGLDVMVGGVGMRRGRRDPEALAVDDHIDWWNVEAYEPLRLVLVAEMKLPGRAWLEFEVTPEGNGARIRQTAIFDPKGVAGLAYWYAVWPLHGFVFRGMLRGIARQAMAAAQRPLPPSEPAP